MTNDNSSYFIDLENSHGAHNYHPLPVVLEKGEIVEQGSYHDLIEKKGSLWKYHQMQNESSQD